MAKIRLRYSAHHDPISWYIRWKSGPDAKHSHVEYLLASDITIGARMFGGVQFGTPSEKDKHVVITEIEVDCTEAEFYQYLFSFLDVKYDFKWLFGWISQTDKQDDHRFSCSEFVFKTAKAKGCELLRSDGWVSPRDLLLSTKQVEV